MQQHPHTPTAGAAPRLRRAVTADHAALADLWKRSVVATHHFLTPQAVDELYAAILQEYLPGVEELWVAECGHSSPKTPGDDTPDSKGAKPEGAVNQPRPNTFPPNTPGPDMLGTEMPGPDVPRADAFRPVGFMGCNWPQIEMLFVEPEYFGLGIGKRLLGHARQRALAEGATLTLDVNEQNPAALAFYEHMGFVVTGRSPVDGQGRPYPLLHMEWRRP